METPLKASQDPRIQRQSEIDILRGIVIILMVLDHTRDFLGQGSLNVRDVSAPFLFLTRWITHFCAPVFVLLAGVSAWLYLQKRGSVPITRRYLLLRGFWLILLELTLIRFSWTFDISFNLLILQVIWVLGWGLIFLALLIRFPLYLIGLVGLIMVVGHNALDGVQAEQLGAVSQIWSLIHEPTRFALTSQIDVFSLYSLLPWVGVMAIGFALGPYFSSSRQSSRFFYSTGLFFIFVFVFLRTTGLYGDPQPWSPNNNWLQSFLSFINCEKYPPSLLFLLMTLGPVFAFFPLLCRLRGWPAKVLQTFGSVPLFLYVIHLPLLHIFAILKAALDGFPLDWLLHDFPFLNKPSGYGLPLLQVYIYWLITLALLYSPCLVYGSQKRKQRRWWHHLF